MVESLDDLLYETLNDFGPTSSPLVTTYHSSPTPQDISNLLIKNSDTPQTAQPTAKCLDASQSPTVTPTASPVDNHVNSIIDEKKKDVVKCCLNQLISSSCAAVSVKSTADIAKVPDSDPSPVSSDPQTGLPFPLFNSLFGPLLQTPPPPSPTSSLSSTTATNLPANIPPSPLPQDDEGLMDERVVRGVIESILTKEVLGEPMQCLLTHFQPWLDTNRSRLSQTDIYKYEEQLKVYTEIYELCCCSDKNELVIEDTLKLSSNSTSSSSVLLPSKKTHNNIVSNNSIDKYASKNNNNKNSNSTGDSHRDPILTLSSSSLPPNHINEPSISNKFINLSRDDIKTTEGDDIVTPAVISSPPPSLSSPSSPSQIDNNSHIDAGRVQRLHSLMERIQQLGEPPQEILDVLFNMSSIGHEGVKGNTENLTSSTRKSSLSLASSDQYTDDPIFESLMKTLEAKLLGEDDEEDDIGEERMNGESFEKDVEGFLEFIKRLGIAGGEDTDKFLDPKLLMRAAAGGVSEEELIKLLGVDEKQNDIKEKTNQAPAKDKQKKVAKDKVKEDQEIDVPDLDPVETCTQM